jgi:transposase InsO family protein
MEMIANAPFPAERHRKLWARLRLHGIHVSRERVRRLVREHGLFARFGGIGADIPNTMWGIDSARVMTVERQSVHVIFGVDHCTGRCVGIDAVEVESQDRWLSLLDAARSEAFGQQAAQRLTIRCDNLPLFRERLFADALRRLGMTLSYIYPLRPSGNGVAERFVRTLRENLLSVRSFQDLSELRRGVGAFRQQYNSQYLLYQWNYLTPDEVDRMKRPTHREA